MKPVVLTDRILLDLQSRAGMYRIYVEIAALAVLCYIGVYDLRTFKIRNDAVVILFALYVLFAFISRSWLDILWNALFAGAIFALLLFFYTKNVIGGGDVKLMTVACLWVGEHCAFLFSALLVIFFALHFGIAQIGYARTKSIAGRQAIPYAPSIAGAVGALMLAGCL
jgi:prepilin peptidase CpaA